MTVDPLSPRFARQRVLSGIGPDGQRRLASAHVVVIGAGGLGNAVLPVLAGAGVGRITVIDDDTVDESNLHRQVLFSAADIGTPKADAAARAIARQSPDTEVESVVVRFGPDAPLPHDVDLLIDGSDVETTRFAANDAALAAGIPLVWGSALRWSGQVGVAVADADFRDLFPGGPALDADTCEIAGVSPTVCTVIGGLMATEALKLVTGAGAPLVGRVLAYDGLRGTIDELQFARDPDRTMTPAPAARLAQAAGLSDTVTAAELDALLDSDAPPVLVDVREPMELAIAALPGATHIPLGQLARRIDELDPDADTVVLCHHGVRSEAALAHLRHSGFARARHLAGGIDAWSRDVDPSVPRY
ncbi:adenylyltransferase/sulfurtransferase MoeZ [Microbacterium awajiense]|uniref:Adenylyltransferase/sulfurtransferase MoeZ n=1 Tax=Microbacterium awajiense TaxID=415214 RepID=A0ABP7ACQ2_9MICO